MSMMNRFYKVEADKLSVHKSYRDCMNSTSVPDSIVLSSLHKDGSVNDTIRDNEVHKDVRLIPPHADDVGAQDNNSKSVLVESDGKKSKPMIQVIEEKIDYASMIIEASISNNVLTYIIELSDVDDMSSILLDISSSIIKISMVEGG